MQTAALAPTALQPSAAHGHSGRLKYADPQDLPSFPSIGLSRDGGAANAAATLGWESQKPPELWKPDKSASATAAAAVAKDYKMAPQWEPQKSAAGSQAAMLAAGSAGSAGTAPRHAKHKSEPPSIWGNSAANQAFRAGKPASPQSDPLELARQGSLSAARGAMAGSRPRAVSSPAAKPSYPDERNAAASALSAATIAHRPSMPPATVPLEEGGAVPYTTMPRQMFTSHPPVQPEVDEQRRNNVIHASAVAMAKQMYNQQQKMIDSTSNAYPDPSRRGLSSSDSSGNEAMMRFTNLQEAAYRLAQERLAKLHEEHQKNREFQEYYDTSPTQPKFTIRGKLRRRSSSDGDIVEDRKRSQQIRQQMSLFTTRLSEVDEQKRQKDREALLAAAQRNVKAQLEGMDKKLYAETGKVPPSMLSEWDAKAQAAALARSETRKNENAGKVDIGGGKFMDQKAIDEIAARRIRPVLDEINEKAEKERERQTAARLEEEARREEVEKEKAKNKEVEENLKKLKEQEKEAEKARIAEIRQQEKARKEEERAAKAEQKRLAKEEKRKAKETPQENAGKQPEKPEQPEQPAEPDAEAAPTKKATLMPPKLLGKRRETVTTPPADDTSPTPKSPASDASASSPTSKVKTWWKKLSRPRARSAPDSSPGVDTSDKTPLPEKGFIGGAALANLEAGNHSAASASVEDRSSSMREVAMAGKTAEPPRDEPGESSAMGAASNVSGEGPERAREDEEERPGEGVSRVSTLSSDDDKFVEAHDEVDSQPGSFAMPKRFVELTPAPAPATATATEQATPSPAKESRFLEKFE